MFRLRLLVVHYWRIPNLLPITAGYFPSQWCDLPPSPHAQFGAWGFCYFKHWVWKNADNRSCTRIWCEICQNTKRRRCRANVPWWTRSRTCGMWPTILFVVNQIWLICVRTYAGVLPFEAMFGICEQERTISRIPLSRTYYNSNFLICQIYAPTWLPATHPVVQHNCRL